MRPVILVLFFAVVSAAPAIAQYVNLDTLVPTLDFPDPDPVAAPTTGEARRP